MRDQLSMLTSPMKICDLLALPSPPSPAALTDPKFYDQMSKLLDDLIKQSRDDAAAYEAFLKKAEELVRKLATKQPQAGVPVMLHSNWEATVLFNNLASIAYEHFQCPANDGDKAELALQIDRTIREQAPAGWQEDADGPRGAQVLNALFPLFNRDRVATKAMFEIIKCQQGYL